MAKLRWDGKVFQVEISSDELSLLLAGLREAWEALTDDELRARTGYDASKARALLSDLRQQAREAKGQS